MKQSDLSPINHRDTLACSKQGGPRDFLFLLVARYPQAKNKFYSAISLFAAGKCKRD